MIDTTLRGVSYIVHYAGIHTVEDLISNNIKLNRLYMLSTVLNPGIALILLAGGAKAKKIEREYKYHLLRTCYKDGGRDNPVVRIGHQTGAIFLDVLLTHLTLLVFVAFSIATFWQLGTALFLLTLLPMILVSMLDLALYATLSPKAPVERTLLDMFWLHFVQKA